MLIVMMLKMLIERVICLENYKQLPQLDIAPFYMIKNQIEMISPEREGDKNAKDREMK